jgi:hypothetical protein
MSIVPYGGNDDTFSLGVQVDMGGTVQQFNQFNSIVKHTTTQFIQLHQTIESSNVSAARMAGTMTGLPGFRRRGSASSCRRSAR